MSEKQTGGGAYDSSEIRVLEGLEPVRLRPGMYIGSTGYEGLHHLIKEIADNSIDEAIAGYANKIDITILNDGGVRVDDNGRGIPVDIHPKTKKSTLETVLTVLHAGGKFGDGGYKVSSGLHGVGSSVVNALSTHMIAEVYRDGKTHHIEFDTGKTTTELQVTKGSPREHGTSITFYPDPTIFKETTTFEYDWVSSYARHQAYLTKGILITVSDVVLTNPSTSKVVSRATLSVSITARKYYRTIFSMSRRKSKILRLRLRFNIMILSLKPLSHLRTTFLPLMVVCM